MRLLGRGRRWRRRRRKKRIRRGGRGTDDARLSHTNPEIWESKVRGWLPLRHMKSHGRNSRTPNLWEIDFYWLMPFSFWHSVTAAGTHWDSGQWHTDKTKQATARSWNHSTPIRGASSWDAFSKTLFHVLNILESYVKIDNWRSCLHLSVFYPIISTCPTWKRGP